jgi:hypothetical protein
LSDVSGTVPANDDPRSNSGYRAARALAIGLGILMVLMFIVVVVTLMTRVLGHGTPAPTSLGNASIDQLPAGSRIADMKVDAGHVVLRIRTDQGEEIRIIDEASGRVVSRVIAPK